LTGASSPQPPATANALFGVLLGQDAGSLRRLLAGDPEKAAPWVRAAAECGLAEAQVRFGRMLLAGDGVDRDPGAAARWFRRAAARGDADGCNMLGRCLEHGWGVVADLPDAARRYRQAAEAGLAWAQYNLGHLLLDGRGLKRDPRAALAWYRRAADQGHPRAMNLVGRCLEHGWGSLADPAQARLWYRRSAEGGYFRGQFNWASILADAGHIDEAAAWFKAALDGAPDASRRAMSDLLARSRPGVLRALSVAGETQPCS
jgi:TPR repeat protein